MRKSNCLEKDIIQRCVSGYRSRGRLRRWTEDIADWTGLQTNTTVSVTEDRHRWNHAMLTAKPLGGRHWTTTRKVLRGMKDYDNKKKTRKKTCRPIVCRMDVVVFWYAISSGARVE